MGILFICFREETTSIMKSAIVVCLAALVAAEPEADAFYGSYGYNNLGLGYSNLGYGYSGAYGYAAPATSAAITVRGYGTPATVGVNAPYGYAASGGYVADSFGAVHIAKREADAEPEADADAFYGVNTYGYNNIGLSSYSRPIVSSYARPIVSRPIVSSYARPIVSSYSRPIVSTVSRIASPVVSSYSAPIVTRTAGLWKREAEPEADAFYGVNTYGYNNIGLSTYSRPVVSSYS